MKTNAHIHTPFSNSAPVTRKPLLQRKCACGGTPGPTGECAECRRNRTLGQDQQTLQPKLRVNRPGDRYEQEADRVAEQVMRMAAPEEALQRDPLVGRITPLLQRQIIPEEEEEEEEVLQAKHAPGLQRQVDPEEEEEEEVLQTKRAPGAVPEVTPSVASEIASMRGRGQALPEAERAFFELRFGHDFSRVRIHADGRAASAARSVQARAFTVGRDVVFGVGQYAPGTDAGRRLLAHELTHVVQQASTKTGPTLQRRDGTGTGSAFLHDCSTWPAAANLNTIVSNAHTKATEAVQGLNAIVSNWGTPPQSVLDRATAMGLRRGFNMEPDKSGWVEIGIGTPDEIARLDQRDRAAAQTILANYRLIAGDAPNYQSAPACTRTLTPGQACLGCVDGAHARCRGRNGAGAFVVPQMIGTPSSPIFFCPGFFGLDSEEAMAEAFLHEVAHLQTFAPSDWFGASRYYGCPVAPIEPHAPGLIQPSEFIGIADSYRCLLETLRVYKGHYEEQEQLRQQSEQAVQGLTGPDGGTEPSGEP